jgi:hypothetical protein
MHKKSFIAFILTFVVIFSSCEREVTIDIPDSEGRLVVEARIEEGMPPIVILSKSIGYFKFTDQSTFESMFIKGAIVTLDNGSNKEILTEICSRSFPDSLLPLLASFIGVDVNTLAAVNFCVYTTLNNQFWGQEGKTYKLTIEYLGKNYEAVTTIKPKVSLDSLWFEVFADRDSLGFIWAKLSEPAGMGDAYRWYAKRLGKDANFIAPFGSVFDDKFIDGRSFRFAYNRGSVPNSTAPDDVGPEAGFFKKGDTVVVKFCTIDYPTYEFLRSYEAEVSNNGNPFASPTTIKSNISGGAIGYWGAYNASYDTVICK